MSSTEVRTESAAAAAPAQLEVVEDLQPTDLAVCVEPPKSRKRLRKVAFDVAGGVPVCGITGINGAGKTTIAVNSVLCDLRDGRTVYSTVPVTSRWGDALPVLSLRQLCEVRDVTILLDDVAVIFGSNAAGSLPNEVDVFWQTLRHRRLRVIWTAPAWMRAHNRVRSVTQGLVSVSPLARYSVAGSPWPRPRLIMAGLLDTASGKEDSTPTRILRRRLYVPSRMAAWGAYDTEADTPLLGHASHQGKCTDCGGSITVPKHSAERHAELGLPWYEGDLSAASVEARRHPTVPGGVHFA